MAADKTARLVDFTVADGKEFWLAFNNFGVITRYNNSDFYRISVDEEHSDISTDYATLVGANLFAHNSLSVRINSHLRTHQLRLLGLCHVGVSACRGAT